MSDTIYRQDAIDALCDNCDDTQAVCAHYPCKQYIAVEKLPSAEPERKTGKWIRNDNGTWSCDQCNSWIPDEQHYYARFCLYCGAKMEV